MTVAVGTIPSQYNGDDSTTTFTVNFNYGLKSEVEVYVDDALQTLDTDYSLTDPGTTGTVTFLLATPATGEVVTIRSNTMKHQPADFPNQSQVESALDRLARQIQDLQEQINRAPKLKATTETASLTFPEPEASELVRFNAAANALETVADSDLTQGAAAAASAAAAETSETNAAASASSASSSASAAASSESAAASSASSASSSASAASSSASAASTSESNASTSETNAAASAAAAEAASNVVGFQFVFDNATSDADPGSGEFRFNNATPASATAIYVDNVDEDGTDVTGWLDYFDDVANSGSRGTIIIRGVDDPTDIYVGAVTGSVTDGTGYRQITVTGISGSSAFTASETYLMRFAPAGADGSGIIEGSTGANDNRILRSDGTGGVTLQASGVTIDDSDDVAGVVNLTQTGYTDLTEISEPASPAANVARVRALDDGAGVTTVGHKDSSGNVVPWSHYLTSSTGGVSRTQSDKLGDFRSVKDFGAVGDATEVASGCGISSSDQTLTAPASTFASTDVGMAIVVLGAGAAGANLYTTIASFTDTDEVELTDAASTTVANVRIIFGTDDTAAIQAALTAGRLCLVPPGNYVTTSQLVLTSADTLFGLGKPKIYPLISSESAIGISDLSTLTSGNRVFDCRVENIDFDGAGSESSIGIDWTQISSGIVRNVNAQDFATGFRLRGIAYYNTFSSTLAQLCDTSYHIHNDGADLSGPNHNRFEWSRVNGGDLGFYIDDDGSTNINDVLLLQPAVESLNASGVSFQINADNLVAAVTIISPRIDVSNSSIVGFQFDDLSNTEKVMIENPHTSGVATLYSPTLASENYDERVLVLSTDSNFPTNILVRDTILLEKSAIPDTPSSGSQKFFVDDSGHQFCLLDSGRIIYLGGVNGVRKSFHPLQNSTSNSVFGIPSPSSDGTATAQGIASTSYYTRQHRVEDISAASTGSNCGRRFNDFMYLANPGLVILRFGVEDFQADCAMFAGIGNHGAHTDADPSGFTNIIGIGIDSGQTTFRLLHNDGSGSATATDLGANFPANTDQTDWYELMLWWGSSAKVYYQLSRLNTENFAQGEISSNLPGSTTTLNSHIIGNTRTGSSALSLAIGSLVSESL